MIICTGRYHVLFLQQQKKRHMYCRIQPKDIQEIETSNIAQQTSFWAQVKNQQGMVPYAFRYQITRDMLIPSENEIRHVEHDLLVLIQYLDRHHCLAYVPYGPKDEPEYENHGIFLEELSEALRPHLPKGCILIRFDLPWENQWAHEDDLYDSNGNWLGPPSPRSQEMRVNFNTRNWNLQKSHTDILPSNTIFLDLNQEQENLMQFMRPKTRYNIRLSMRKGVQVNRYGIEHIDNWHSLYSETAFRNNITLHPMEGFYYMMDSNRTCHNDDVSTHLLLADYNGEFLAGMFLLMSKKRATYLFGASASRQRNLMATYAVQWEAIKMARANGCEEYDMFGTAPNANPGHPLYGLNRFKTGFGGNFFHRMGCWDYPLDQDTYMTFRAQEINNQSYHVN